jgi:hypothetical protein
MFVWLAVARPRASTEGKGPHDPPIVGQYRPCLACPAPACLVQALIGTFHPSHLFSRATKCTLPRKYPFSSGCGCGVPERSAAKGQSKDIFFLFPNGAIRDANQYLEYIADLETRACRTVRTPRKFCHRAMAQSPCATNDDPHPTIPDCLNWHHPRALVAAASAPGNQSLRGQN